MVLIAGLSLRRTIRLGLGFHTSYNIRTARSVAGTSMLRRALAACIVVKP